MRKLLLFALLLVSTSSFSQIPDSLEVTLPWDLIYVADCNSDVGAIPTTTNDAVYISAPEITLVEEDDNGGCYKKVLEYTIIDWFGNNTYTFTQILKVDEMFTLYGVSDVSINYDDLPFSITATDLVVDTDPTHIYSFDPHDALATIINYDQSDISGGNYHVFVYDQTNQSVTEVNVVLTDCEEDVFIDVPASFTVEFNGESYISLSAELFDINIIYPCADYELNLKHGTANRIYSSSIGETIEIEVKVVISDSSPLIIFTEYIKVAVTGEGPVPIPMYIEEKTFIAGEEITLDIWSDQLDGLIAWQFRLNVENARVIDITEGSLFDNIPHNIFNDDKTINSLWTPGDGQAINVASNETWFSLTIMPSFSGNTFDIFTTENDPWSSIFIEDSISIIDIDADFSFQIAERNFLVPNEELEISHLLIHNNPVSDRLIISGFTKDMNVSKISIFSIDGSLLMSRIPVKNSTKLEVDVEKFQSGIYILSLNGSNPETIRFVKI